LDIEVHDETIAQGAGRRPVLPPAAIEIISGGQV
jgi:hypothetical protein